MNQGFLCLDTFATSCGRIRRTAKACFLALTVAAGLVGCNSGDSPSQSQPVSPKAASPSPSQPVSASPKAESQIEPYPVSISPRRAAVTTAQRQQFTTTISGGASSSVIWEVDTIAGGNAAVGTISSAGLYTPPSTAGTHTISVRSMAETKATANASIAVTVRPARCNAG